MHRSWLLRPAAGGEKDEEESLPGLHRLQPSSFQMVYFSNHAGKLSRSNGIKWRGNSGLTNGVNITDVEGGLVGGYYDAGGNIKYHFPLSFAMTMLSWSVIEYEHKYHDVREYEHIEDLIKWGTDCILLTFDSNATKIDNVYTQVGLSMNISTPDDHYCWQRPEDMEYVRPVQQANSAPELGAEMASALAAASIVFRDDTVYSAKLLKGTQVVFAFARDFTKRTPYSHDIPYIEHFYNSSSYWDEYIWGSVWLYFATGKDTYLSLATNPNLGRNAKASLMQPDLTVLSWDNKLPAAMLLLTRVRVFLSPGYPYEEMLSTYHNLTGNLTGLNMCSYLHMFNVFNFTKAGLIELNHDGGRLLQYAVNAAFMASLFVDYMKIDDIPGWYCGDTYFTLDHLRKFAVSQVEYILGANPMNTPNNHVKYSCTGGWRWRDSKNPNPNNITGAMVGGPDRFDMFLDQRSNFRHTEPTLAGNAGLVASMISLTSSGGDGVDRNTIFSFIQPLYPSSSPPPPPWQP